MQASPLQPATPRNGNPGNAVGSRLLTFLFRVVLPAVVLAAAVVIVWKWMTTVPMAERHTAQRVARLVEVVRPTNGNHAVVIDAMGVVRPAQTVDLKPQVSGRLEWVSPNLTPGTRFRAGESMMRIEARDYQIALAQRQAEVGSAENAVMMASSRLVLAERDLQLEMGSQAVALHEFELLGRSISEENRALVLREPQLQGAKADVEAAKAEIASAEAALAAAKLAAQKAELDLARTTITAPFNVIVEEKLADVGDTVTTGTPLLRLVGTDEFWIELSVPEGDLRWIELPGEDSLGSEVQLFHEAAWGEGVTRTGRVIRRLPSVSAGGRMARLLVAVDDPLALDTKDTSGTPGVPEIPALLVDSYLRGQIIGRTYADVIVLPRELLHPQDRVYVMRRDGTLELRQVSVLHRGRDTILIREGLSPDDHVVTTELAAPVDGTLLRVEATALAGTKQPTTPSPAQASAALKPESEPSQP